MRNPAITGNFSGAPNTSEITAQASATIGALSAFTAILNAPGQTSALTQALSPDLLLIALTAATHLVRRHYAARKLSPG